MFCFEIGDEVAQPTFCVECPADLFVLALAIPFPQVIGALKQAIVEPVGNLRLGIQDDRLFLPRLKRDFDG